jgi:hypothetical protein
MTPDIEAFYPRIGRCLRDAAGEPFAFGYARVELGDGHGSVGLFVDRGDGSWHYIVDDGELYELFSELRDRCIAAGLGAWSQATFALRGSGRFELEFGHDDVADLGQAPERRAAWVRRVLGPAAVVRWS